MSDKFETEEQRRHAITWALALTTNMPQEANHYEQYLLEQYAQGVLTLDQALEMTENQIGYILYQSEVTHLLNERQLYDMLEDSRVRNQGTGITGLLCYSQGQIVQLLEGPRQAVDKLYATIRGDTRHQRLLCLREGSGPARWFPDWRMAFVQPDLQELYWVVDYIEARRSNLILPVVPIADSLLLTLLQAFSTLSENSAVQRN